MINKIVKWFRGRNRGYGRGSRNGRKGYGNRENTL